MEMRVVNAIRVDVVDVWGKVVWGF